MQFATGHDMKVQFIFGDGLGQLYTSLAVGWTVVLASTTAILIRNRQLPFLRVRNIPLSISAVATLHVYWVLCMLAYGFNGYYPCTTEFWIMNIYLPFGIALFHAYNSQFLFVAGLQRKFVYMQAPSSDQSLKTTHTHYWRRYMQKFQSYSNISKTMYYIAIGMTVQFIVTILVFFLSKRFHPKLGVFSERMSADEMGRQQCRQGFEWIPSIVWQLFWAWFYAPYLLWKVRGIHDVNGWRLQTVCCCLVGLPASPMWLIALYLPQMKTVSQYVVPPMWFTPSIFLIEIFIIFVPCWQIVRNRRLQHETLRIIAEWERQKNSYISDSSTLQSGSSATLANTSSMTRSTSSHKAQNHLYTMAALDKALDTNSKPLLLFAALKDFSGENISFINHVGEWKRNWCPVTRYPSTLTSSLPAAPISNQLRHQQFLKGIEIYSSFVSLKYSSFPINISSTHLRELEAIFETSAAMANDKQDPSPASLVAPFETWQTINPDGDMPTKSEDGLSTRSNKTGQTTESGMAILNHSARNGNALSTFEMKPIGDELSAHVSVPSMFGPDVFENALQSVKYTVLTNTWPKFVNNGYAAMMVRESADLPILERFCGLSSA